jgi:hypothetical protein
MNISMHSAPQLPAVRVSPHRLGGASQGDNARPHAPRSPTPFAPPGPFGASGRSIGGMAALTSSRMSAPNSQPGRSGVGASRKGCSAGDLRTSSLYSWSPPPTCRRGVVGGSQSGRPGARGILRLAMQVGVSRMQGLSMIQDSGGPKACDAYVSSATRPMCALAPCKFRPSCAHAGGRGCSQCPRRPAELPARRAARRPP